MLGKGPDAVGAGNARGVGVGSVFIKALDGRRLDRREITAHRIEPDQVGEAVILAVGSGQAVNALGFVQGLESLQVPEELTQDDRIEQPLLRCPLVSAKSAFCWTQ